MKDIIGFLSALEIEQWSSSSTIQEKIRKRFPEYTSKITVQRGASKKCLVFQDEDFVIKWATGDVDPENNEAVKEIEVYQDAKEKHLEQFFPKTELLAEINGVIFVKQEKIDFSCSRTPFRKCQKYDRIARTVSDHIFDKMASQIRKAGNINYSRDLDYTWGRMVISLYGKKVAKALCDFIIDHEINDLHGENLGYKNNKPVLLDFSGYDR